MSIILKLMNTEKQLKKYQITYTAYAFETIEAYDLQEALDLAKKEEAPQLYDFSIGLTDTKVELHPDEFAE